MPATEEIVIDKIIRSKRKSIGLEVTRNANLIVRAPNFASMKLIRDVILNKQAWIKQKQELVRKKYQEVIPKEFIDGEDFFYLGKTYPLQIVQHSSPAISFNSGFKLSSRYTAHAREILIYWYQTQALEIISKRVDFYASLTNLKPNKIKLSNAKKRWGSCSYTRNLNFNWRLIMAPLDVIDYIVVHELVHLEKNNHSKDFWDKVKQILPDYKQHEKWLKQNGHLLYF